MKWISTLHLSLIMMVLCMIGNQGMAQTETSLAGSWVNEQGTRKADFYVENDKTFGKLTWVQDDSKLKAGHILFKNLVWDGKRYNGQAVTARGTVDCAISFDGANKIKVSGSKGGMSKTVYWTRIK
ncbi:MAG: DUF2147 domain-containing protein [Bacteroidetes bacterium]|nr:DUF2147 domain-containing protein [Bacteroidota bacterium]